MQTVTGIYLWMALEIFHRHKLHPALVIPSTRIPVENILHGRGSL